MLNTLLTLLLQTFFGLFIVDTVRRRYQIISFKNQLETNFLEEDISKINSINLRISELASKRIFISEKLIMELESIPMALKKEDAVRQEYRNVVQEWNIQLSVFNVELRNLGLYNLALGFLDGGEDSIQYNFRQVHEDIRRHTEVAMKSRMVSTRKKLNKVKKIKAKLSKELSEQIELKRTEMLRGKVEPLTKYNVGRASNWTLIKAIFYSNPNRLSVPRSLHD